MVSGVSNIREPMMTFDLQYIILNLGMSPSFQKQDYKHLQFPSKMYIDYVRVYQRSGTKDGITCNPPNYPTTDYINKYVLSFPFKTTNRCMDQPYKCVLGCESDNMVTSGILISHQPTVQWRVLIDPSFATSAKARTNRTNDCHDNLMSDE
jgi:hypothetical protein